MDVRVGASRRRAGEPGRVASRAALDPIERYRYALEGWGSGELHVRGDVVLAHDLTARAPARSAERAVTDPTRPVPGPAPLLGRARPPEVTLADEGARVSREFVSSLLERIGRQLAGETTSYDEVRLDLSWCTPFQAALAAALRAVPWGDVVTYGELAALAGRPGAARAAGSFCAQNRFWLLVPCHRVVAADGIGGYGDSGVGLKRRLLALEGVEL